MMTAFKVLVGGIVGAAAFVAAADAADMPKTWPADFEKPRRYVELLSGWYLRTDFGYRWNHIGSVETAVPTTSHDMQGSVGATFGGGFRYQWFRTDITLDYGSQANFRGYTAAVAAQPQHTAKIDAVSGMMNFYVDFGTWAGFTPYAGGGVGATYVRTMHYRDSTRIQLADGSARGTTNFSWAWMAGAAFQIHPQWLVDVGFRHLALGDGQASADTGLPNDYIRLKRISANEVRVGLRFLFD